MEADRGVGAEGEAPYREGRSMPTSPEAQKTLEDMVSALNSADVANLAQVVASTDDVLGIGSDPDEWWLGRDRLLSVLETQMREMEGARWELGEVAGSSGWAAAPTDVILPDGTRVPGRLTVALSPDGKVEHFHFSIGTANEEAIGQELTT